MLRAAVTVMVVIAMFLRRRTIDIQTPQLHLHLAHHRHHRRRHNDDS